MLAKKEISPIVKPKVCEEEIKIERDIPGRKEIIKSKNGTNINTKNRLENQKIMWVPK